LSFTNFIKEFRAKKGGLIVFSSIVEKIGGLLLYIIATNLIPKNELGFIVYANTSLDFIFPFIGFGVHQGLIRYGSLAKSQLEKNYLFQISLKKGLQFSLLLVALFAILSPFITLNLKPSLTYLLLLSFQLISLFLFEIVRIYIRIINLNRLYAQITIAKVFFLVLLAFLFTLKFTGIGYVIVLSLAPLFVAIYYIYKLDLLKHKLPKKINFNLTDYISYGMFSSFAGVLSQLLFTIDIMLIANMLKDESLVAHYKISTILPFSFLILSMAFIRTNFVKLANKSESDKTYIKNYYLNYLKIFSVLSILIIGFFYFFSDTVFLLFGKSYQNDYNLMFIFSIGIAGGLLLRVPLGNILSAVGLPKINALNSFIVLIFNLILSYFLITKMGIKGAAIATSIMFWFSGILSLIAFIWYLRKK